MKHVLQWHIIHRCNLRCTHCYQEDYAAELTGEQLEAIFFQYLEFCRRYGFKGHINFTGGEPLLSPELFRLLGLCEENGITYGILTNGTLIDEALAERLGELKGMTTVNATVVYKRRDVRRDLNSAPYDERYSNTNFYYVTFEEKTGNRLELLVSGPVYDSVRRGEKGLLSYQGLCFVDFLPKKQHA